MRLLDLFCGAGGAAMGYHRAGFDEIVGVDIKPQPHYPFTFIQADAMTFPLEGFDAIHASPPCQRYSVTTLMHRNMLRESYPDLVVPIRDRLQASGTPFVIENVPFAPLVDPIVLCGRMFDLRLFRHRLFECSWPMLQPGHTHGKWRTERTKNGYGSNRAPSEGRVWMLVGNFGDRVGGAEAMGVPWMQTKREIAEAIPPAYTEFIGRALIQTLASTSTVTEAL